MKKKEQEKESLLDVHHDKVIKAKHKVEKQLIRQKFQISTCCAQDKRDTKRENL
jgi:hypothetical protein